MKFMLVVVNVYYVVETTHIVVYNEKEQRQHEHDDMLCRGYILSTLTATWTQQ